MTEVVELYVVMHCEACEASVRRAIRKIPGVESYKIDFYGQKVTVTGKVDREDVWRRIHKTGKRVTLIPKPAPPKKEDKKEAKKDEKEKEEKKQDKKEVKVEEKKGDKTGEKKVVDTSEAILMRRSPHTGLPFGFGGSSSPGGEGTREEGRSGDSGGSEGREERREQRGGEIRRERGSGEERGFREADGA